MGFSGENVPWKTSGHIQTPWIWPSGRGGKHGASLSQRHPDFKRALWTLKHLVCKDCCSFPFGKKCCHMEPIWISPSSWATTNPGQIWIQEEIKSYNLSTAVLLYWTFGTIPNNVERTCTFVLVGLGSCFHWLRVLEAGSLGHRIAPLSWSQSPPSWLYIPSGYLT